MSLEERPGHNAVAPPPAVVTLGAVRNGLARCVRHTARPPAIARNVDRRRHYGSAAAVERSPTALEPPRHHHCQPRARRLQPRGERVGGPIERKRPFSLLRLSGTPVRALARRRARNRRTNARRRRGRDRDGLPRRATVPAGIDEIHTHPTDPGFFAIVVTDWRPASASSRPPSRCCSASPARRPRAAKMIFPRYPVAAATITTDC